MNRYLIIYRYADGHESIKKILQPVARSFEDYDEAVEYANSISLNEYWNWDICQIKIKDLKENKITIVKENESWRAE